MATAMIGTALSVVRTALSPLTNSLLEKWAASNELGSNVRALQLELLAVQALLEHTAGKEIVDNSAFKNLLVILQDLGYDAEDVLDELEYFRIQDELDGTFHAANEHAKGCAQNLVLNLHHTAKAVGKQICCLPSCFSATAPGTKGRAHSNNTISSAPNTNQANREASGLKANLGKCFPCSCLPSVDDKNELEGTSADAADKHGKGCAHNLLLNVNHTAKAVGKQICLPSCFSATAPDTKGSAHSNSSISSAQDTNQAEPKASGWKAKLTSTIACCNTTHTVGKCFPCSSLPSVRDEDDENSPQTNHRNNDEPPKLRFNRVDASTRMQHIVEQLRVVRGIVSSTIATLGSDWSTVPNIAQIRPITISESIEPELYGRNLIMDRIIHDIIEGKHSGEHIATIPIVGLGGIGKTTLAQHIYHSEKVQNHFEVKVWTCVSLNFNVNKLLQEIGKQIPTVEGESGTTGELIGKRLKNKRFLVVLDDIWDCSNEDEWEQLVAPFKKSQALQGSIIMVTTRFPAQAKIMIQKIDDTIYLEGLDDEEFKKLFLYIIFGDDQSRKKDTSLLEIGDEILGKLKGSPLAAKTVGRILRNQLDVAHWNKVLESKEWEQKDGINDIMPALKLSYYYLPSYLQLCFPYCGLFPQDYRFKRQELINFWIGLEILHSSHGENKRIEDIGLSHLSELVNYGFLEKNENSYGIDFYTVHDLLHDLARKVSSHECLSLHSSQSHVSSLQIPPSIRHLSITIDDESVEGRLAYKTCVEDFNTLDKKIKVEKLRSLILFGYGQGCFVRAFSNLFREAVALRVILLSYASYDVEHLLHNFYNLMHLRYLRIGNPYLYDSRFINKISRFYQMMVLHLEQLNIIDLPRDMSNLAKLRHFLVKNDTAHSSIVEVGKLKSLQELRSFVVNKESQGFELRQIGHLEEICGSLCIDNLENVKTVKEADEAKLTQKNDLHELILCWSIPRSPNDSTLEEHVLERLRPSNTLLKLSVKGHRGTTCPSWLGTNLSVRNLESLCLEAVAWKKFPPIGESWDLHSEKNISGGISDRKFGNLRRLKLCKLSMVEWVVHAPCQLLPLLKVLVVKDCPQLKKMSFEHFPCCQQGKEVKANLFPKLIKLKIRNCPQLSSFPSIPWTVAPCSINIKGTGSSCLGKLVCGINRFNSEYDLTIDGKDNNYTDNCKCCDVLAFHNLTRLNKLEFRSYKFPPLRDIQMLSSLRTLEISSLSNASPFVDADNNVKYQFPVESLKINSWNASGKDLTQLLTYFPKLSNLWLEKCEKVTGLGVNVKGQQATDTPRPSSSAKKVEQQEEAAIAEDDRIVASEEAECGLLLLPPQLLQDLVIRDCPELSILRSNPHDDSNEEDGGSGGGGLQGLTSLRRLVIWKCPKILSAYSSSSLSSSFPLPNSMEDLGIYTSKTVGMDTLLPISNLTSLTSLSLSECEDLRGQGLLSLLAQGHLTNLNVTKTPNFFVDSEPSQVHEQEIPPCSSKLQELQIDDVAGFTDVSTHRSLLLSSLTTLIIFNDDKVERFTEQQEALLLVNSLGRINFSNCSNLQSLPEQLHRLPNLKTLYIWGCKAIQMLPKDGLPSSQEVLEISGCPEIQSLPKACLPDSLQTLKIEDCPAIRSLPKVDDLPSSLRELYVHRSNSEELRRQCRKLINIIPFVRA